MTAVLDAMAIRISFYGVVSCKSNRVRISSAPESRMTLAGAESLTSGRTVIAESVSPLARSPYSVGRMPSSRKPPAAGCIDANQVDLRRVKVRRLYESAEQRG